MVNTQFGITARTTSAGTTYYTRMPDGRLLASHGAGGTFFYVTDYQKSVVAIIGTDGQRAGTYRYAPYGEPTLVEATAAAQNNPFRWHGGYYGIEGDGYYKFGARYYDAEGHFTQPDPVAGNLGNPLTLNSYGYAGGDPCNETDPTGRSWLCWGAVVAMGARSRGCDGRDFCGRFSHHSPFSLNSISGSSSVGVLCCWPLV